jgi:hypothetical protein
MHLIVYKDMSLTNVSYRYTSCHTSRYTHHRHLQQNQTKANTWHYCTVPYGNHTSKPIMPRSHATLLSIAHPLPPIHPSVSHPAWISLRVHLFTSAVSMHSPKATFTPRRFSSRSCTPTIFLTLSGLLVSSKGGEGARDSGHP